MPTKVTLKQIFDKLTEHDGQFQNIDRQFNGINEKLASHDKQFANVAKQIFNLEDSIKADIGQLKDRIRDMDNNSDKFTQDMELLKQEYHMITAALRRIEGQIAGLSALDAGMVSDVKALKERAVSIEDRLLVLETH